MKNTTYVKLEYVHGIFGPWGDCNESETRLIPEGTETTIGQWIPHAIVCASESRWCVDELNDWSEHIRKKYSIGDELGQALWIAGLRVILEKFTKTPC